jgi:hypothetical protein
MASPRTTNLTAVENYSPVTVAAAGVDAEPGVSGGYSTAVDVAARPLQFRQVGSSSVTGSTDEHRAVFGLDDVGLDDVRSGPDVDPDTSPTAR